MHRRSFIPHSVGHRLATVLLAVLLLGFSLGSAVAQNEVTGTVRATLDGTEREWVTLMLEGEETDMPSAAWHEMMGMITTIAIQAHPEPRFAIADTLTLEVVTFEFPSDCPCTYQDASVMYWTTDSLLEDLYTADAATVVITSMEPLGDDAYALEGTVDATLSFMPTVHEGPDASDTIAIAGTFSIDRMPRNTVVEESLP